MVARLCVGARATECIGVDSSLSIHRASLTGIQNSLPSAPLRLRPPGPAQEFLLRDSGVPTYNARISSPAEPPERLALAGPQLAAQAGPKTLRYLHAPGTDDDTKGARGGCLLTTGLL